MEMNLKIALPTELSERAQHLAGEMGVSVEQLLAAALSQYLSKFGSNYVTRTLDTVYETEASSLEPGLLRIQADALKNERW